MIIWDRQQQCKNCFHECGWDEAREMDEFGHVFYEKEFECALGNACDTDSICQDFAEDE